MSKAPSISRNIPSAKLPEVIDCSIFVIILCNAASVEKPLRKPNCLVESEESILRSNCKYQRISFSINFNKKEERFIIRYALGRE